jgi:hypothetical protein
MRKTISNQEVADTIYNMALDNIKLQVAPMFQLDIIDREKLKEMSEVIGQDEVDKMLENADYHSNS